MKTKFNILLIALFLVTNCLTAQIIVSTDPVKSTTTIETEVVEEEEEEKKGGISISGFVDAYYQYHFNEQPFPTSFTETHNSITPGMANVVFSKEGKVGFVADIAFGPRAEVANGYTGTTLAAIKQLFVTYSPSDAVTFTLGNFGTHVGYEIIDSPGNVNYSTSYMFSNGPFYHTGLKVDYAINDNFGAMVGIFNDTDSKIDEVSGKHIGAQLSYSDDALGVYLNYIGGKDEEINDDEFNKSNQIDLTATYQVTDAFGLGLNATNKMFTSDVDGIENTSWFGAALYANYATSDIFTIGARVEYIGDSDGAITGIADNSILDLTLSGNITIGGLKLIPEFRVDIAGEDGTFADKAGEPTKTSPAFIFGAMYSF